jgi:hypothetical protein
LDGETKTAYALVSQGNVVKPNSWFDNLPVVNQKILPIMVQVQRQPFWLGAIPGTAQKSISVSAQQSQKSISVSAQQSWAFAQAWAVETTDPTGYAFCFAELANGNIYVGGASEILLYTDSTDTWSTATTTPVTLAADVTSAVLLDNGDLLFGESGRIIKRNAAGTWSVETSTPTGQVYEIIEATSYVVSR